MTPALNQKEVNWLLREKYDGSPTSEFYTDVLRLNAGEPLAYVIGWIPFFSCKIDLSLHPMIPRTETEFLIERAIGELRKKKLESLRLADTFSGSGCIGVALLKHLPNATVEMSELDPILAQNLTNNVRQNGIDENRVLCTTGNSLEKLTGTYDAVFANPPYIDPKNISEIDKSVINFEPHLSLFAGDRGLDYLKIIIANGEKHLNEGGTFYVECDPHQRTWIEELLVNTSWKHEFWEDQFANVRFLVLRK